MPPAGQRTHCSLEGMWLEIPVLCNPEQSFKCSYSSSRLSVLVINCKKAYYCWVYFEHVCNEETFLTDRVKRLVSSITMVRHRFKIKRVLCC